MQLPQHLPFSIFYVTVSVEREGLSHVKLLLGKNLRLFFKISVGSHDIKNGNGFM